MPRWGMEHKQFVRKYYKRSVGVKSPVQELAPDLKDAWGIPTLRLSGHRHPHDLQVARFIAARCEEWLKRAGAIRTWQTLPGSGLSGGQHQAGTCRMGNDPKTSVVDGSVHVNNGGFNPSLTIQAIA